MQVMRRKLVLITLLLLVVASGGGAYYVYEYRPDLIGAKKPAPSPTAQQPASKDPEVPQEPAIKPFNKKLFSLTDPTSPWVVVNKLRPIESNFAPDNLTSVGGGILTKDAADAMTRLLAAAKKDNIPLSILSSYRSYSLQDSTYKSYVAKDGAANADTYSARPGHSEHQTGLAADLGNGVCDLEICFGETAAGRWLAANAHEHGFIIRYPKGKQTITGYQYEPWHVRYLGNNLAKEIYEQKVTLEEFFELGAAPDYE